MIQCSRGRIFLVCSGYYEFNVEVGRNGIDSVDVTLKSKGTEQGSPSLK